MDIPIQGIQFTLVVRLHQFEYGNPNCDRVIFVMAINWIIP